MLRRLPTLCFKSMRSKSSIAAMTQQRVEISNETVVPPQNKMNSIVQDPSYIELSKAMIWSNPDIPTRRSSTDDDYFFSMVNMLGKVEKFQVYGHQNKKETVTYVHFGKKLGGAKGMVHGGCIATIIDELFVTSMIWTVDRVGFTANMSINYRAPVFTDTPAIIVVDLDNIEGRKVYLKARVEDNEGNVLVDASTLFVVPKNLPHQLS